MGLLDNLTLPYAAERMAEKAKYNRLAQAFVDRQGSVMSHPLGEAWRPDHERIGGHALQAPMISPDDLLGTGIPNKLAGLLMAGVKSGGVGLLGAGMIKSVKNTKNGGLPEEIRNLRSGSMPQGDQWNSVGMLNDNMSATIRPLTNGDFALDFTPQWGSKSKPFYAIGDDAKELADYSLSRIARSDKAVDAAAKRAEEASLLGMLKKEYGDVFSLGKSTQSKSQYITHDPSGTKIRISDHDLPLHYEQSDVDLRNWQSPSQMMESVKKHFGK